MQNIERLNVNYKDYAGLSGWNFPLSLLHLIHKIMKPTLKSQWDSTKGKLIRVSRKWHFKNRDVGRSSYIKADQNY